MRQLRTLYAGLRRRESRAHWFMRLTHPENLFQPFGDTRPDRYPGIFSFVAEQLRDAPSPRILSYGCSTGEEAFTLRGYLPEAEIRGVDINPLNVAVCRRRWRATPDPRMSFGIAGSAREEPTAAYDAIFCLAVLRHGDLSYSQVDRCDHRITFQAFEATVEGLARCLKVGGFLALQHSNFRFCDTATASSFRPVLSIPTPPFHPQAPLFGSDNRRLRVPSYDDVVFEKRLPGDSMNAEGASTGRKNVSALDVHQLQAAFATTSEDH